MVTTTPARASDACAKCEKRLSVALERITADDLQIEDHKKLEAKQDELIARLSAQRDDAFTLAKGESAPWLSDEAIFLLGLLAGVGATLLVSRAAR